MGKTLLITIVLAVIGCARQDIEHASGGDPVSTPGDEPQPSNLIYHRRDLASTPDEANNSGATIKPLTAQEQDQLLRTRLDGRMNGVGLPGTGPVSSFRQFANMFLVSCRIQIGTGVGLMTSSEEIAELPIQSPFPASYKPTLREILDVIALQTFSEWKYDPSSKYFRSEVNHEAPVEGLAIFEFTKRKTKRDKPFDVTLADGWRAVDKGNWVMYVPPSFPVGMDIYEMGTYSSEEKESNQDLQRRIRSAVALEWSQRINKKAEQEDLTPAKVGAFDALYYESMLPAQPGQTEIRWRQWAFMVGDKCYFVMSTIPLDLEESLVPDVEEMLASFRVKTE